MLPVFVERQAKKFTQNLQAKQKRQIAEAIVGLRHDPVPQDSCKLDDPWRRKDVGEFRIIYCVAIDAKTSNRYLHVLIIAKRNDNEVYRLYARSSQT